MPTLTQLASALPTVTRSGEATVATLAYDSRAVTPGALYVAVVGASFDGHLFIGDALARGAAAVVVERPETVPTGVPFLQTESCRQLLAPLACAFYDNPTHGLTLAGVTGTNGKTSTVQLIDAIARATGERTGTIGTLGATIAGTALPHDRTTPEAPDLQRLFAEMRSAEVRSAAMEVASHALSQARTGGCAFDVGVFTNLTQDHLDYHKTMDAYEAAKGLLFTEYPRVARAAGKTFTAVLNQDDAAGRRYAEQTTADRILTYSPSGNVAADIVPEAVQLAVDSLQFRAKTPSGTIAVEVGFGGTFQVANVLAAIGYGLARGIALETIAAGLAECPPVTGRFHPVQAGQPFAVLVDYAHTPDGLENVLRAARPLTEGRLIVVFGCGGNRDTTKRPIMGRLAQELADIAIVTSDNPRKEDPERILDDILAGMLPSETTFREADRRSAIALAVQTAQPGDTVVIAGKGHEDYQILADRTISFSDLEVAAEEIRRCR